MCRLSTLSMGDCPLAEAEADTTSVSSSHDDGVESCTQRRSPRFGRAPRAAHRARLLVVDDDAEVRRSLARQLRATGYYVDVAPGGREAIDYVDQTSYDVVLSDIRMPTMDGIELLQVIRRHDLNVPVVLLTGAPTLDTAVQAFEFGAFHYLAKGGDVAELERVVDRAARWRRQRTPSDSSSLRPSQISTTPSPSDAAARFDRCLEGLWMAYHPIVDVTRRAIFGHEALMRSAEPTLPHPASVLEAAKRLGRLDQLGRLARGLAAREFATHDPHSGLLFVNLNVTDLADPQLTDPDAPLSKIADRVVLEVTERSSLDEVRNTRSHVAALREMGFRIAVDDMGSGYAGLTSFALLEPEYVKLDMALIRDVHLNTTQRKIIRSMAELCRDLGMQVVAEGVETVDERDVLIETGCELLQGFLFARPGKPFPEIRW